MMLVELVRAVTEDGLRLDGALARPRGEGLPTAGTEPWARFAFLLVHGTGSHFYAGGVLEVFARQAVAEGHAVLRINTRGHDGICTISGPAGGVRGGATYERIDECPLDLTAWLRFLADAGFVRVVLVGHSMGAVKAIYTLGQVPCPEVVALIALSPPRFCHARLLGDPRAQRFRDDFARARQFVRDGQPDALFPAGQPLPYLATAAGFIEKYGPEDRYDFLEFLPLVPCPALILMGSESVATSPAFENLPDAVADGLRPKGADGSRVQVVTGANIQYAACPELPYHISRQWLAEIIRGRQG